MKVVALDECGLDLGTGVQFLLTQDKLMEPPVLAGVGRRNMQVIEVAKRRRFLFKLGGPKPHHAGLVGVDVLEEVQNGPVDMLPIPHKALDLWTNVWRWRVNG